MINTDRELIYTTLEQLLSTVPSFGRVSLEIISSGDRPFRIETMRTESFQVCSASMELGVKSK